MKFLTKEQFKKERFLFKERKYPRTPLYNVIATMGIGAILKVKNDEVGGGKSHPTTRLTSLCHISKRHGYAGSKRGKQFFGKKFSAYRTADKKYWIIRRIK